MLEAVAQPLLGDKSNGSVGASAVAGKVDGVGEGRLRGGGPGQVIGEGREEGRLQVEEDDRGEEGPDRCREGKVHPWRKRGILRGVGDPTIRSWEANVLQDGMPALVAIVVQQTPTEFKVFSMPAQWGSGQSPPSIIGAVLLDEHFGTYWRLAGER